VHLALCIAIEENVIQIDGCWPFLIVADFPASLLLFGLTFRDGHFMLWFGVFGTLWSYGVSWAAWAAWSLVAERKRRALLSRPSGPDAASRGA